MQDETYTPKQLEDFLAEAEIFVHLRPHPNVLQCQGACVKPGRPLCIVSEYLPGGSLYDYIAKNQEIEFYLKIRWLKGIAAGMVHLHAEGIVHRDLAARNVLLTTDLSPKISDFGLSRLVSDTSSGARTRTTAGPLKWMAPECLLYRHYSIKSDVWAFGVTMFEIMEQKEPYEDLDPVQTAAQISTNSINLGETFNENSHPEIDRLARACFQREPDERPDFNEVCQILSKIK